MTQFELVEKLQEYGFDVECLLSDEIVIPVSQGEKLIKLLGENDD